MELIFLSRDWDLVWPLPRSESTKLYKPIKTFIGKQGNEDPSHDISLPMQISEPYVWPLPRSESTKLYKSIKTFIGKQGNEDPSHDINLPMQISEPYVRPLPTSNRSRLKTAVNTQSVRKATGKHLSSAHRNKNSPVPVSGFCYTRNRVSFHATSYNDN